MESPFHFNFPVLVFCQNCTPPVLTSLKIKYLEHSVLFPFPQKNYIAFKQSAFSHQQKYKLALEQPDITLKGKKSFKNNSLILVMNG